MPNNFNFSKYYSIQELHSFFKDKTILPYSYSSFLNIKTQKYNRIYNVYISFNENMKDNEYEKYDLNYLTKKENNNIFNGIPFNIKDCFLTKDFPTTYGVNEEPVYSKVDSGIIQLFKDQGAILLGKTSIPSYAYDVQTYNDLLGITKNPWNVEYSSGGSTGGGAVSVVTGLSPIAIGSDFAGSIRIPAHFCGVKGYIPSYGRKFLQGHYPDTMENQKFSFPVGQVGFISNFLSDFKHIHELLISKTVKSNEKFSIDSFKYAVLLQDEFLPVSTEVKRCLQGIFQKLSKNKVDITYDRPKDFSFKDVGKIHAELMKHLFDNNKEKTKPIGFHLFENLQNQQKYFEEELNDFVENRFWILPVTPTPAIPHNTEHNTVNIDGKEYSYWRAMIHYSRPFNIINNPIVTIPVGLSQIGLPIGIQIIGQTGNDLELLNFAEYLSSIVEPIGYPIMDLK